MKSSASSSSPGPNSQGAGCGVEDSSQLLNRSFKDPKQEDSSLTLMSPCLCTGWGCNATILWIRNCRLSRDFQVLSVLANDAKDEAFSKLKGKGAGSQLACRRSNAEGRRKPGGCRRSWPEEGLQGSCCSLELQVWTLYLNELTCVFVYIHTYIRTHICMCTHIYIYRHTYTCTYTYTYTYTYTCLDIYIYIHMYIYTHIYIYWVPSDRRLGVYAKGPWFG